MKQWGIVPVILLYAIFPLTFTFAKAGFHFGPQLFFIATRMILSGLLLLIIDSFNKRRVPFIKRSDWGLVLQTAVFGVFLTYAPEFWSLKYLPAAKVALLFVLTPFFSFLFEYLRGTSLFSYKKMIGLLIGSVGVLMMMINPELISSETIVMPAPSWFLELVVIFSVGCYSYGWFAVQTLIKERSYSSTLINGMRMLVGGILCIAGSFFIDPWSGGMPVVTDWGAYGWYIFLISCIGIFCYTLYANLLKHYSITFVAFAGFTEPLFAAFYAWILLGETVSWIFFIATGIVGIGLYQFYQEELRISS